jgi:UrcA family protein
VNVVGQPVLQERINLADLDLRRASGKQALKVRVLRAADRVCAELEGRFPMYGLGSPLTCSDLTYQHVKPQIAEAFRRAESGQQVATMALVISATRAR